MDLSDVALAYWRLDKWVKNTNVDRKAAANSSLRKIKNFLDDNGYEIKDFLGQQYDVGLAVDVISKTTDDVPEYELIITETLEPLILERGEVSKFGKVVIGKEVKAITPNDEAPPYIGKPIEAPGYKKDRCAMIDNQNELISEVLHNCELIRKYAKNYKGTRINEKIL